MFSERSEAQPVQIFLVFMRRFGAQDSPLCRPPYPRTLVMRGRPKEGLTSVR